MIICSKLQRVRSELFANSREHLSLANQTSMFCSTFLKMTLRVREDEGMYFNHVSHKLYKIYINIPVKIWFLSPQHGVSSGCGLRNGLQICRVAANILNKQLRTADKGWSSSLRVVRDPNDS